MTEPSPTTTMGRTVLDVPMAENDSGANTIRGYLKKLLATLWEEGEGFDGKRPFGNSSWESDLEAALVKAGLVKGVVDEDGDTYDVDEKAARSLIFEAISELQ